MIELPGRALLAALLLLVLGHPAAGAGAAVDAADAAAILRRAEEVRNPELDYAVEFEILISDPEAMVPERRAAYTLIAQGKERSLVLTREPERLYGSVLMIDEGHYWLLLPRATRSLELSPRQRLGGSVANGDLARANLSRHYRVRLEGADELDGEPSWLLELNAADELAAYPRIRAWISRRDDRPLRLDYYGHTGERLRRARFLDYRESRLGRRSHRIEVREKEGSPARTTILFEDLRPLDLAGLELGVGRLVEARDRALELRARHGRSATAEEMAEALRGGAGE